MDNYAKGRTLADALLNAKRLRDFKEVSDKRKQVAEMLAEQTRLLEARDRERERRDKQQEKWKASGRDGGPDCKCRFCRRKRQDAEWNRRLGKVRLVQGGAPGLGKNK